jgi:hypothetical protein
MRRLAQDSGGTSRIARLRAPAPGPLAAVVTLIFGLIAALPAGAPAAPAGCAGKPGTPDRAALLQYCPKTAKSGSGSGAPGGGTSTAGGQGAQSGSTAGEGKHHATAAKTDKPDVPLTNYPSSGGINLLLLLLLLLALGLAVAYGARRWRRSRPQAS